MPNSIRPFRQRALFPGLLGCACAVLFSACGLKAGEIKENPALEAAVAEPALPVKELADELFKQIETSKPEGMWEAVNRLVRLARGSGTAVTARLAKGLAAEDEKVRLACARALCQLNDTDAAAPVLYKLIESGSTPELRRQASTALALTTSLNGDDAVLAALSGALKTERDALTQVWLAKNLWLAGSRSEGRDALLKLMLHSKEKEVKDEAALVLAENGSVLQKDVRLRLLNLYNEPTAIGERARNILLHADDETRTRENKLLQGEQLMRELVRTIKLAYPDESKADLDKLFEDAAKGMLGSLDPFSEYMDREQVKQTQEVLQQDYGGIGAYVGMFNGNFVITSPIYGSPADRAGLRARDVIQEVDGVKANELLDKGGIASVIAKLKGKPGTPVRVKYYRRGFSKSVEISILRENIRVETVFADVLPGGVGYVRLTRFGERSSDEMQSALEKLLKTEKCRALILDLRDNPGGLLRGGVDIADKFLAGNKLIVYSEGNKDFAPRKDYRSTGGEEDEAYPMVCLVGAGSASASEIVAGALQDHKRAPLIGEKTYGKGSVQQIMPVRATDRQTQLRLTVARYFLPTGRCIHEKGVEVDVEVKPAESHSWIVESLYDLRRQSLFDDYVRARWDANKELFGRLALHDGGKCENWPDFDEFYTKLNTRLERDLIRGELRYSARRRVQDERKQELVTDLESDDVLQRGVLEALKKLNVDPLTIAEYRELPEKFKKKEQAHQGAMLPGEKARPN